MKTKISGNVKPAFQPYESCLEFHGDTFVKRDVYFPN